MKTYKNTLVIILLICLCSCESFVTGIDEQDITRATDADLRLVVNAGELHYAGTLEGEAARLAGLWSGYFYGANRQYATYYAYSFTTINSGGMWNNVYTKAFKQLRIAQAKAREQNNLSTLGICQVMEASIMGSATALWGDIPYSEAIDIENFPNPRYDSQTQIIDTLIVLLDEAIANLNFDSTISRLGDFLFTTNAQWVAVAYSIKARLLLYRKDYANALLAANAGIQTPANDLVIKHGTTNGVDRNLYFQFLAQGAFQDLMNANNTHLGKLVNAVANGNRNHAKTNEAARLTKYYSGTTVATYVPNTGANGFFATNASFPLHTAFETKLIAAECFIRMGDFTNALAKLNEHRANLRTTYPTATYTNFTATDFNSAGIENVSGTLTPNDALLREILEEKYVCLYGQIEGFNEMRRTNNALGIPPNAGTEIPQRFLYSQTEINANSSTPNPIPDLFEKVAIFK